jgi:hypothetical protein
MPVTHSAIASSKMPAAFVRTTSLSASAGNRIASTPAEAVWIQRSRDARGHAGSRRTRCAPHAKIASARSIAPETASAVSA